MNPSFSPDGQWIAYNSNPDQLLQLVLERFPSTGTRYSLGRRGIAPIWAPDGKRLFVRNFSAVALRSVPLTTTGGIPEFGTDRAGVGAVTVCPGVLP